MTPRDFRSLIPLALFLVTLAGPARAGDKEDAARAYVDLAVTQAPDVAELAALGKCCQNVPGGLAALAQEAGSRAQQLFATSVSGWNTTIDFLQKRVAELAAGRGEELVPALRHLLRGDKGEVLFAAPVAAKLRLGGPLSEELCQVLDSRIEEVYSAVPEAFEGCGDGKAIERLRELAEKNEYTSGWTLEAVLRTTDPDARSWVRSIASDKEARPYFRGAAVEALGRKGLEAKDVTILKACLREEHGQLAMLCFRALDAGKVTLSLEELRAIKVDEGWGVNELVAVRKAEMGDEGGAKLCLELTRTDYANSCLREGFWAAAAKSKLACLRPEMEKDLAAAADGYTRGHLLAALGGLGDADAIPAMAKWLEDEEVRDSAEAALAQLAHEHPLRLREILRTAADVVEQKGFETENLGRKLCDRSGSEDDRVRVIGTYVVLATEMEKKPAALRAILRALAELAPVEGEDPRVTAADWSRWWAEKR